MWNEPTEVELNKIPRLYETENVSAKDKIIHMHFFIGNSDWFIAEFDGDDIFFGFAYLNGMKMGVTNQIENWAKQLVDLVNEWDN